MIIHDIISIGLCKFWGDYMARNKDLIKASQAKADEFYTQLVDVERELSHYKDFFKNKIVFCNCDDPFESNFFKYFAMNFNVLGLKKLITTCYSGSPIVTEQLSLFDVNGLVISKKTARNPYKIEITEVPDLNNDGAIDLYDVAELIKSKKNTLTLLEGDGDFRSEECIELLKQCDVVVTNPPFSLFREFISILTKYNKDFLIIGNQNAITYKEFFPLLKANKVWMGASIHSGDREFRVPNDYNVSSNYRYDELGNKYVKVRGPRWWTNLDYKERHDKIILYKKYNPKEYPKYDNYNAINVNKTTEIPVDYSGVMGVPITFLDKYNPDQFRILGCSSAIEIFGIESYPFSEEFMNIYKSGRVRTKGNLQKSKPCYIDSEGFVNIGYHRIFIQAINKESEIDGD